MMRKPFALSLLALGLAGCAAGAQAGRTDAAAAPAAGGPDVAYSVWVGAESADLLHRVRFGPGGATVEKTLPVGEWAVETEGPHGLAISRDGRFLYMTTGHGVPDGKLWKFELGPDTLVGGPLDLGRFPATLDVTPDGLYAFVVNFNLHGEHVPSSVSVVYTPDMVELERIETCTMPHGSRISPDGARHYSACMMDDQLVEIDTRDFEVARLFYLGTGGEGPIAVDEPEDAATRRHGDAAKESGMHHAASPRPRVAASCSPTWAQPSADGRHVYVACNQSDVVHEISVADWRLTRSFAAGAGPYNLAVTPDGRLLLATLKRGNALQVFDLERGESVAVLPAGSTVTHGVVVSPDGRYAFVSNEAVGAQPGVVDVFDLRALARVASVDVGQQAGGIAFWRVER